MCGCERVRKAGEPTVLWLRLVIRLSTEVNIFSLNLVYIAVCLLNQRSSSPHQFSVALAAARQTSRAALMRRRRPADQPRGGEAPLLARSSTREPSARESC